MKFNLSRFTQASRQKVERGPFLILLSIHMRYGTFKSHSLEMILELCECVSLQDREDFLLSGSYVHIVLLLSGESSSYSACTVPMDRGDELDRMDME